MIRLILVDPDPDFEDELGRAIEDEPDIDIVAVSTVLEGVPAAIDEHKPVVTLLGPNIDLATSIDFVQTHAGEGAFILFSYDDKAKKDLKELLTVTMIEPPLTRGSLLETIRDAADYLSVPEEEDPPMGRVLTVFSTKGGVGKTTLSSNLSSYFAKYTDLRVVTIDLDLQFGDIGVMLGLKPERTIYDCLPIVNELNGEIIDKFLTHHQSGLRALLAPLTPERADLITGDHLRLIINALRETADIIVVDTPAAFNDHVLTALDTTDLALLVTAMDIPSVKNIKLALQTLKSLAYPDEQIGLAINRVDKDMGIKAQEIEHALATKAMVHIPQDKRVQWSVNKGVPVVLDAPKSPAGKALIALGDKILERLSTTKRTAQYI